MPVADALAVVAALASPASLDNFRAHLDPAWIEEALRATGTSTIRKRRLPSEQVIWVVLGMAMFRDRSIADVVAGLDLALAGAGGSASKSAVAQARKRVGSEPLKWLFDVSAAAWSTEAAASSRWRGLAVYGVDGTSLRVPDSPENRAEFGGQSGRHGTESSYPLVRIVTLMALRSHLLRGAVVSPYTGTSELSEAQPLFTLLVDESLTIVDKHYLSAATLLGISQSGHERHWLTRAKSNTAYTVIEELAPGDRLVELNVSAEARRKDPTLPLRYRARAIRYAVGDHPPSVLLTSLLDPAKFPAEEVVDMYHERWELELGYDEVKTHLLLREEAIRSQTPEGVRQETWGILLAYNMIRLEMARVAEAAKVAPTRISFVASVQRIRSEWEWLAITSGQGTIPKKLLALREDLKRFVLPPRRRERAHPRAVKIKMSSYPRKRPAAEKRAK
jgi:hypothetical protein